MNDEKPPAEAGGVKMWVCPLCSRPPVIILDGGHQAFCGTDDCPSVTWDMYEDLDTLLTHAKPIKITGWDE